MMTETRTAFDLTSSQEAACDQLAATPFNVLVGTAGVGKTVVARELANRVEGCRLASTTGIASVNLGSGTTINALLKYFDTNSLKDAYLHGALHAVLRKHRKAGLRRILIDEVSMMNGQQLAYITKAVHEVNTGQSDLERISQQDDDVVESVDENYDEELDDRGKEYPPIGITLVGDFGQLPPVPDTDPLTEKKLPLLFAFESPVWDDFYAPHVVKLTEVLRQDARPFIDALHAVRRADIQAALDFFTPDRFSAVSDDQFLGTTIVAKNDTVDRFNAERLEQLTTPWVRYVKVTTGKPRGDWKQIPDVLALREGALVMLLANRRDDLGSRMVYANGDLGVLRGKNERGEWIVTLQRTGRDEVVLPLTRENLIPLEPGRRKELTAQGFPEKIQGKYEVAGTVTYMPMRCAYACTVHKTQGLTLDNVQVSIRDHFFKSPSMLFVALSRARTAEGLRIVGDQRGFVERCTMNARVRPWL